MKLFNACSPFAVVHTANFGVDADADDLIKGEGGLRHAGGKDWGVRWVGWSLLWLIWTFWTCGRVC